jgi:hypothetical protein
MGQLPSPTRLGGSDQYATSRAVVAESRARGLADNIAYVADGNAPMDGALLGSTVGRMTGLLMLSPAPLSSTAAGTAAANNLSARLDRMFLVAAAQRPPPGNYYNLPGGGSSTAAGKRRTRLTAAIRGILRGGVVSSLARGRVIRAAGATARCSGRVRVTVRRSKRGPVLASRLATVARNCRWSKRFVFSRRKLTRRQRRQLARRKRVALYASFRYGGNSGLLPSRAKTRRYFIRSRR